MQKFTLTTTNGTFRSESGPTAFADLQAARREILRSAIAIAGEEVAKNVRAAAVEMVIKDGSGEVRLRECLTVATATLKAD